METATIDAGTCVVRNTAARKGRTTSVAPGTTASRYLHYGRIILSGGDQPLRFETGDRETGIICLKGSATVQVDRGTHTLERYDSLYVPRDSAILISAGASGCDCAEIAAPVKDRYPIQFVAFRDVQQNPGLHFSTGGPGRVPTLSSLRAAITSTSGRLATVARRWTWQRSSSRRKRWTQCWSSRRRRSAFFSPAGAATKSGRDRCCASIQQSSNP